jgi:2,3-dihydroxybenzoate decarboxylase
MTNKVDYRRIATEEAWVSPEILKRGLELVAQNPPDEPGFVSMWGKIEANKLLVSRLLDLGEQRLRDMDASGIDMQLLMLTAPGVQVFDAATANSLAVDSNDQLAEACRNHPDRFAGMAAVAPQDPAAAAKEIERGMKLLDMKGIIINSHTKGEYLDDEKFWEIFEAAEACDAPIYIHPRTPAPAMLQPYLERGFELAMLGFGAEVALHTLAIIQSGAFDRFPRLKIVIGHAGEGLPYWLYRIDYMSRLSMASKYKAQQKPSDYMKHNIWITTSGVPWAPAVTMAQSVIGVERVLYAMDYPYQYVPEEVTMVDEFPISADDKKRLFETNAVELFKL